MRQPGPTVCALALRSDLVRLADEPIELRPQRVELENESVAAWMLEADHRHPAVDAMDADVS
jgi:hypothetical protein